MGVEMKGIRRALLLLALSLSACGPDDVVATVGSTRLTADDLRHFSRQVGKRGEGEALDALIERQLLAEEATRRDLHDRPEVRAALAAAKREVLAQALLEQALVVDEPSLRERYAAQRDEMQVRRIHVRQIFVQVDGRGEREARVRAQALYARVLGGEDFAEVASAESDDRVSASRGGELGAIAAGQLDPVFFDEAAKLRSGQTSAPIRTQFGFHIVQALRDVETITPTFDEARGKLAADMRREGELELREWVRSSVRVKIHAPLTARGGR